MPLNVNEFGAAQCDECGLLISEDFVTMLDCSSAIDENRVLCPLCSACCDRMKANIFPQRVTGLYIQHWKGQGGCWAMVVNVDMHDEVVYDSIEIAYCPFCGTLLEA